MHTPVDIDSNMISKKHSKILGIERLNNALPFVQRCA